jgi:predicted amidophosphoribosyltransferase
MKLRQGRLSRERHTIQVMIEIHCREQHHPMDSLCAECQGLLTYTRQRIDKCPYQVNKPTCAKCPIHCYKPAMREQVRQVMRYAGPRMIIHYPMLAVLHSWDEITKSRKLKGGKNKKNQI